MTGLGERMSGKVAAENRIRIRRKLLEDEVEHIKVEHSGAAGHLQKRDEFSSGLHRAPLVDHPGQTLRVEQRPGVAGVMNALPCCKDPAFGKSGLGAGYAREGRLFINAWHIHSQFLIHP